MRLSALVHVVPRRACTPMFCGTPPASLSPGLATFYPPIFVLLNPFCVFVFCVFSAGLARFWGFKGVVLRKPEIVTKTIADCEQNTAQVSSAQVLLCTLTDVEIQQWLGLGVANGECVGSRQRAATTSSCIGDIFRSKAMDQRMAGEC